MRELEVLTRSPSTNRLTLRLQNDILEVLRREAHRKDLTLNALISKILNKSIAYEEHVNAVASVTMPHDLLMAVIDRLPEADIAEIAKNGQSVVKKLFNILGIAYDIDHVIYNYFAVLGKYCGWYEFSHKVSAGKYRLVFCAGTCAKWSIFVQAYVRSILESLKIVTNHDSKNDGVIVFEFSFKNYII